MEQTQKNKKDIDNENVLQDDAVREDNKNNNDTPIEYLKNDFLGALGKAISKMFDCCRD